MARSDSSRACVPALWLWAFADRPRSLAGARRSRGLPVLVHVVSQRARVLRLRRTDCSLASITKQPCCLPPIRRESASWFCVFRSSIARPTDTPVYASSGISRCHLQVGTFWELFLPVQGIVQNGPILGREGRHVRSFPSAL